MFRRFLLHTAVVSGFAVGGGQSASAGGFDVRIVDGPDIIQPTDIIDVPGGPLLPAIILALLLAVSADGSTGARIGAEATEQ